MLRSDGRFGSAQKPGYAVNPSNNCQLGLFDTSKALTFPGDRESALAPFVHRTIDDDFADAFSTSIPMIKIKTSFRRSEQTIEMIYGSLPSRAEIPPRSKADRPPKIFFNVIERVQTSPTKDSYVENDR
jgi:hypothetical protein